MNLSKQNKILKKQNETLLKELNQIRFDFANLQELNSESVKHAKELIERLVEIKAEWVKAVECLDVQRDKYNDLIEDIRKCRNGMVRKSNMFFKRFLRK